MVGWLWVVLRLRGGGGGYGGFGEGEVVGCERCFVEFGDLVGGEEGDDAWEVGALTEGGAEHVAGSCLIGR